MFGIDDAVLAAIIGGLASAGTAVYSANNAPKAPGQTTVVGAQGGTKPSAESVFSINTPQKAGKAPAAVNPPANDPMITQLLGIGPPRPGENPGPPGAPATLSGLNYTGGTNPDPYSVGTPSPKKPGVTGSQVMAAMPGALAAIAPLLAMAQQQQQTQRQVIGAQGGGRGGELVPGLNLPRRQTMAEILASLPRPRYG